MGIYSRYSAAVLAVLFFCVSNQSYSATRKHVWTPPASQIINNGASGATYFPNGAASWVGPEYIQEHVPGNAFKAGDSPTATSKPVKVPVKAGFKTSPAKIAKAVKTAMKFSPAGAARFAASAGVTWAINQIPGGTVDPVTSLPMVQPATGVAISFWAGAKVSGSTTHWSSLDKACKSYSSTYTPSGGMYCKNSSGAVQWTINESKPICPYGGTTYSPSTTFGDGLWCSTVPQAPQPFTDQNYDQLEAALATLANSDWLKDLFKKNCEGSLSPDACYQEFKDQSAIFGPSSQLGPKYSTTSTTTNPDGTTSTTTTTTQDKYDYTYGDTYFDFTTTTTTTTNNNGQTTTTITSDAQPEGETPQEEQKPEDEADDQEYTFEDSTLPPVEPFYEQKYPDGLQGVWSSAKSDFDQSAFVSFLNSFVPSFSGTCPAFSMSFAIGNIANFGTHGFGNLCYALDFVKVCIMLGALFLCRSIVFGG